jgi:hypothetical protein
LRWGFETEEVGDGVSLLGQALHSVTRE